MRARNCGTCRNAGMLEAYLGEFGNAFVRIPVRPEGLTGSAMLKAEC